MEICQFMAYEEENKIWVVRENDNVLFHTYSGNVFSGVIRDLTFIPDSKVAREYFKEFDGTNYDGTIGLDLETLTGENFEYEPYCPLVISKIDNSVYKIVQVTPIVKAKLYIDVERYNYSKWSDYEITLENFDNLTLIDNTLEAFGDENINTMIDELTNFFGDISIE